MTTYRYFESENLVQDPNYDPDRLLDFMLQRMNLKNDAALCRALDLAPPIISKIRHRRNPVSASVLLRMHAASGAGINDMRKIMGDSLEKPQETIS